MPVLRPVYWEVALDTVKVREIQGVEFWIAN